MRAGRQSGFRSWRSSARSLERRRSHLDASWRSDHRLADRVSEVRRDRSLRVGRTCDSRTGTDRRPCKKQNLSDQPRVVISVIGKTVSDDPSRASGQGLCLFAEVCASGRRASHFFRRSPVRDRRRIARIGSSRFAFEPHETRVSRGSDPLGMRSQEAARGPASPMWIRVVTAMSGRYPI